MRTRLSYKGGAAGLGAGFRVMEEALPSNLLARSGIASRSARIALHRRTAYPLRNQCQREACSWAS